jgi:CheY-like chemotaxis protein
MDRPAKHVLLVEDHAATLVAFVRALSGRGFIVHARSSVEAAETRESEYRQLDMAILDVHLPGKNGDEYAVQLRSRHPRLPIIFITADRSCESIKKRLPDAQILIKPIDVQALMESFIY